MKSRIVFTAALLAAFVLGVVSVHPMAIAYESLAATACKLNGAACIGGKNSGTGPGVIGTSTSGSGIWGQTTLVSTSSKFGAGLLGQDLSTSGKYDVGVWGKSTRGDAVLGTSTNSAGLYGSSVNSVGAIGTSTKTTGVYGTVTGGSGSPTGVYGQDKSTNINGAGVAGQSNVGTGVIAATLSSSTKTQALIAASPNGAYIFSGVGANNQEVAAIDGVGDIAISGEIFTSGQCQSGCVRHRVRSYAASESTPTIEDTGEAQLVAGAAFVRIDPAFANAIDPRQGYSVLITPEGDTRGLYVVTRTPAGFQVRENMSGRSTAPFAYRIVAHPYGVRQPRLPLVETRTVAGANATAPALETGERQ